jgi:hypothetical protein
LLIRVASYIAMSSPSPMIYTGMKGQQPERRATTARPTDSRVPKCLSTNCHPPANEADTKLMRAFAGVVALGLVLAIACGRDRNGTPQPASSPVQNATGTPPSPSVASASPSSSATLPRSGSVVPEALAGAHCLSAEERERDLAVSFKLRNELAVVRVAPNDGLWMRQGPGAREKPVGKLAFDTRNVTANGRVCRNGDTTWYEVSSGGVHGFANGNFLVPATEPADETARFAKLAGSARFASPEALAQALRHGLEREQKEQSEVRFEATLVGVARSGTRAVVVLYACCYADDSVMGEQIWIDAVEREGRWLLDRARASRLCPRGASKSACI